MNLSTKIEYTLTLSAEELRLIVAALAERLKEEQKADALELQRLIVVARASCANQTATQAQKYANNLE